MISCKLRDKTYSVDFVTGRALREIDGASRMLGLAKKVTEKLAAGEDLDEAEARLNLGSAMDTMVRWFCVLFQNQFTPADVYDNYPNDQLLHDIAVAIMAVQMQTTETLNQFPMKPTV